MHHVLFALVLTLVTLPTFLRAAVLPRQELLDVCANIDVNLFTLLGIDGLLDDTLGLTDDVLGDLGLKTRAPLDTIVSGELDVCLCLSAFPLFLSSNVVAAAAADVVGVTEVETLLKSLINTGSGGRSCRYPKYSVQSCTPSDPCHFTCQAGYVLSGGNCVPHNGPSSRFNGRYTTPACRSSREMVCGVPGMGTQYAWECVDVTTDLESCGGCVFDSPFNDRFAPRGKDCTRILNVADVACSSGSCNVLRCMAGFTPNLIHTSCVPELHVVSSATPAVGLVHALVDQLGQTWAAHNARQELLTDVPVVVDTSVEGLTDVVAFADTGLAIGSRHGHADDDDLTDLVTFIDSDTVADVAYRHSGLGDLTDVVAASDTFADVAYRHSGLEDPTDVVAIADTGAFVEARHRYAHSDDLTDIVVVSDTGAAIGGRQGQAADLDGLDGLDDLTDLVTIVDSDAALEDRRHAPGDVTEVATDVVSDTVVYDRQLGVDALSDTFTDIQDGNSPSHDDHPDDYSLDLDLVDDVVAILERALSLDSQPSF